MRSRDLLQWSLGALREQPRRTVLMVVAMAIGVAAVTVLTAVGEGARRYVIGEFASLGSNLVIVVPGRSETVGGSLPMFVGDTTRDLTLEDAMALTRLPGVTKVAPLVVGEMPASWQGREREVPVLGTTAAFLPIRKWRLARGRFLPGGNPEEASAFCVIGEKVRQELFGAHPVLGEQLRVADRRCIVIGTLASTGRSIGVDSQEVVIMPVALAQMLFDTQSLFRILIEARSREELPAVQKAVLATLRDRHQGEEDVTVITQDAVLSTFDRILRALTLTVAGIGAISLAVAGILTMNVLLIAVSQRRREIGLLKALGAERRLIVGIFLAEAALLSGVGVFAGLVAGEIGASVVGHIYPFLPVAVPWWARVAAGGMAIGTGLLAAALPARRAARLDPVDALARR